MESTSPKVETVVGKEIYPGDLLTEVGRKMRLSLMLSVAYSANIGGTGVVTGTTPNLILMAQLERYPGYYSLKTASLYMVKMDKCPGYVFMHEKKKKNICVFRSSSKNVWHTIFLQNILWVSTNLTVFIANHYFFLICFPWSMTRFKFFRYFVSAIKMNACTVSIKVY